MLTEIYKDKMTEHKEEVQFKRKQNSTEANQDRFYNPSR